MHASKRIRWTGLSAMLGGALWVMWAIMVARKPEGCIGSECDLPGKSVRGYGDLVLLLAVAVLAIAVGVTGLVLHIRSVGRFGRLGRWGLSLGVTGTITLAAAVMIQSMLYDGDFPHMPLVVIPAGLTMALGFLLFSLAILRLMPRWVGALLIVGTLALVGVNDQDERILLSIPFGLAWIIIGYTLWSATHAPLDV